MLPLQLIDTFLLDYHLGHILLLVFVLSIAGSLPLKSQRVVGVNVTLFGAVFAMAPFSTMGPLFILLGLACLVIGPLLYTTG